MKKFFTVLCLLITVCLVCTGCAKTSYAVYLHGDGSVEQLFVCELDKDKIEGAGHNYNEAKNYVENIFMNVYIDRLERLAQFRDETHSSITDFKFEQNIKDDMIYLSLKFPSVKAYKYYYSFDEEPEEETDDTIREDHLFYVKNINKSKNFYSGIDEETISSIESHFNNDFDLSDCEYNFYYGVPTDRLYSEDSEIIYTDDMVVHHWSFDAESMDNEIITYTISIKPIMWYVLALSLAVILAGVLGVVCLIQKKSKKVENTIENIENK
ncbi:MAG: hypothetical protein KBT30_00375 [Clostridiales bacterium]|nr:hypothetical protein [Candidatus Apopatousia equi]